MIVLVPCCSHCSGWWDSPPHSLEARRGWVPCPPHLPWQWRHPLCLCEVGAWSHCLGWFTLRWWPGSPKLRADWASRVSSCLRAPFWSLSSRCLITQKGPGTVFPTIRSIYSRGPGRQGSGRQFLGEWGVVEARGQLPLPASAGVLSPFPSGFGGRGSLARAGDRGRGR